MIFKHKSWQEEAAELAAIKPRKILFICVQNSARSQLAEAIARHLAPEGVEVLSAGSKPSSVRPEVNAVLSELGISGAGLYSKSVNDIAPAGIEAVITLCAEGVCPVFLSAAPHLHWALPDPAAHMEDDVRLEAFRSVRDELLERLRVLLNYRQE